VNKTLALLCMGVAAAQNSEFRPDFRNVAKEAGLTTPIPNGGSVSKEFILETTGSGAAFLDYDNDGLADIFLASGPSSPSRMYHNEGGGKFRDVTVALGFTRQGWAQGVCAGDYDNDGYIDLFVTYWGQNSLYRNVGGRRFEDVTEKVHLTQDRVRYNTGCAFIDYDNDGRLDLFIANYLNFDFKTTPKPGANPYCFYRGVAVSCGPRGLPFDRNILYHNDGGVFRDVSDKSGVSKPDRNYSLGVLTGDFNGDGLTDIYVASDQTPSILYINRGNGTFVDEALIRGAAFDENGKALSGMGVAAGDYRHEGIPSIFRTNFSDELSTLYHNRGKGEFQDVSVQAGLGQNTRYVGWGCAFLDSDNDGWPDVLLVNGHAFPEIDRLKIDIHYRERAILYHNDHGKFVDISESAGPGILEQHSSRGLALADYDNDGFVEAVVNNQNETPSLLRLAPGSNRGPANHWIGLKLEGVKSNRSAIGARVRVTAGSLVQTAEVRSGGSYLSQSDLRLNFGLGGSTKVDKVEVTWPGGATQTETGLAADRIRTIRER
jgi:enediyne biosynthesis protein E4